MSSQEITEQMAYDMLDAEGLKALSTPAPSGPPLPAGAARRIRLDSPDVLAQLDRYWPPEP